VAASVGMGKDSPSFSTRVSEWFTGIADFFSGQFTSISAAVSSSYSGLSDTSTSGASEESRRRRRERRSRRRGGESELDVTQDMQIG
jgi:hypothetical protein